MKLTGRDKVLATTLEKALDMTTEKKDIPLVADIMTVMERWAPRALAEQWDNCGLQIGSRHWPVKKIWVALDPLVSVIAAAARNAVDLVITHHPLTIKPIQTIDVDVPLGKVIEKAITTQTAIFSAHTNLDSATDGINDILAQAFGMTDCVAMVPAADQTGAREGSKSGLGRFGRLEPAMSVEQLVHKIKAELDIDTVKVAGNKDLMLERVAVCSGSGGSLLDAFFKSDAQVYICGDMRYHDARSAEDAGKVLIDVGHFPSEHIVVDALAKRLRQEMAGCRWSVQVEACSLEKEPFEIV